MHQVVQAVGHLKRNPGVNASGGPDDGTPGANSIGKHINPKFAERVNVPYRPLEGLSGRSARRFCLAERVNVPQKAVEWHMGRSANFGLRRLMGCEWDGTCYKVHSSRLQTVGDQVPMGCQRISGLQWVIRARWGAGP